MKKIDESQKRRFGVLAGLKDPTTAKREEKAEQEAKRKRVQEHVNRILEGDEGFEEVEESDEVEEGKHTKKGPTHIKGGKSATKNLSEMDMGDDEDMDDMGGDDMDDMGGDMGMEPSPDMEMGADDGMGPGADMGGGDEDLATRIITRVVDAIKAELGVDVSVSSGAPEPAVPGAGMETEPDMDDMGGEPDAGMGDEDEMLHEDETFQAGGKATKPSVAKVDSAHPDHKLKNVGGKMNESSYRKSLTNEIAKDIAKQAILEFKKGIAAQKKKK